MFYNYQEFNQIASLAEELIRNHVQLRQICQQEFSGGTFLQWPEPIHNGGWTVHGRVWEDQTISKTTDVLSTILFKSREMIRTAGFSRLEPHTEIAPHKGYTGDVLRFHLGIDIPDGDCALIVNGVTKKWKNGEILIFDDTFEHSAHNRTDHPRTVLLLDIYKRCFQ